MPEIWEVEGPLKGEGDIPRPCPNPKGTLMGLGEDACPCSEFARSTAWGLAGLSMCGVPASLEDKEGEIICQ